MDLRRTVLLAGGGAVAALALVSGAVMAQTPESSGTPGGSATPGAQSTQSAPDTAPQPATPGQSGDKDCPDKGGDGSTTTTGLRGPRGGSGQQSTSQFRY